MELPKNLLKSLHCILRDYVHIQRIYDSFHTELPFVNLHRISDERSSNQVLRTLQEPAEFIYTPYSVSFQVYYHVSFLLFRFLLINCVMIFVFDNGSDLDNSESYYGLTDSCLNLYLVSLSILSLNALSSLRNSYRGHCRITIHSCGKCTQI